MATDNNLQGTRYYTAEYKGILNAVFEARKAFANAFTDVQILDGISSSATAFTVKTSASPVVVNTYSTGANVGFGTGSSTSRFGNRTEVVYADTDVNYSYDWAINEGLDASTVNAGLDNAVADRLALQSEAQVRKMNVNNGTFLSASAGKTLALSALSGDAVQKLFSDANKELVNNEVTADKTAYVTADVYALVVDLANTNSLKGATINIGDNTIVKYKGFKLVETPEQYFVTGEVAYFTADGVAIPFVGISTARTIDSEFFDGKALQAHSKGGQFISDDNKKAVVKATYSA